MQISVSKQNHADLAHQHGFLGEGIGIAYLIFSACLIFFYTAKRTVQYKLSNTHQAQKNNTHCKHWRHSDNRLKQYKLNN